MRATYPETRRVAPELLGASPLAETARVYVARAADTGDPVLISAEQGLDALAICRAIHDSSALAGLPFIAVECVGQTADELAQHLSSLTSKRTVVLANLDELPSAQQQALTERLRADAARGREAGPRIMAAVTGNVEDAIAGRTLSRDLRMCFPVHLELPPLRRRPADIPLLVAFLAADAAAASHVGVPGFSRDALALLAALPWRRNLEELREVLDVLVLVGEGGTIQLDAVLDHVPIDRRWTRAAGAASLREARNHFEREYIASVLSRHRGRMDEAARTLGVQRTNLYRKVRQLGIGRARSK